MKYADYLQKRSFSEPEVLGIAYGTLIDDRPDNFFPLPTPPMLMIDRIVDISRDPTNRYIIAERNIRLDDWFFGCHFLGDPVQPGCLGVDAIWQLLGFYCSSSGTLGTGRALGCKEVDFFGQIRPHNRLVRYEVNVQRYQRMSQSGHTAVIIGSGKVFVDGELIYNVANAKAGFFLGITYSNYPFLGRNAMGGTKSRVDEYNRFIERGGAGADTPETSIPVC